MFIYLVKSSVKALCIAEQGLLQVLVAGEHVLGVYGPLDAQLGVVPTDACLGLRGVDIVYLM